MEMDRFVSAVAATVCAFGVVGTLLLAGAGSAAGYAVQYCAQIPMVGGIPPWGFHTGDPITGATGSYARGHGDINLDANTVSGILCQVDRVRDQPDRLIIMTVEHHLVDHSHDAVLWGVPGNIMTINVRVKSSTDARCKVGTIGTATLFASYNGVRSDSVQFVFPAACRDHDHLYHGPRSTTRSRRCNGFCPRSPGFSGALRISTEIAAGRPYGSARVVRTDQTVQLGPITWCGSPCCHPSTPDREPYPS